MKNYYKLFNIIFLLALVASCSEEIYETQSKVNFTDNEIQFEQFKTETGLTKFKVNLDISNQNQALNKTLSMVDFVIDTVAIKKHISIDKKNTYSFRIYPINSGKEHGKFYNIVYRKENNKWESSIVSFKKNEGSNHKQNKYKDVVDIYNSAMRGGCTMEIITIRCNGSCTRNDKNAECDGFACETGECLQHTFSTVPCNESGTSGGAYVGTVQTSPDSTTNPAGGGGVEPQLNLQNPYVFIPNDTENPYFVGRNYINQVKAQEFWVSLGIENQTWAVNNTTDYLLLIQYQIESDWSTDSNFFSHDMIGITKEISQKYTENPGVSEVIYAAIYAKKHNYLNSNLDSNFFNNVNTYSSLNLIDPVLALNFTRLYFAHCAILRKEHPEWSNLQIFANAYLDTLHLLLDFAGLVPAFGEVADITNGAIYTIQGQGSNAALSYASAIPFAGWFSAGVKFAKRADGLSFLVVGTNNIIHFGAANSKKFRTLCGLLPGDATRQAHHLIPRGSALLNHPVMQRAAKAITNGGFHIDSGLNALAVATWRNQPNHQAYNDLIYSKLQAFIDDFPNATPNQCYDKLVDIINDAKQAILDNPNLHIKDITF